MKIWKTLLYIAAFLAFSIVVSNAIAAEESSVDVTIEISARLASRPHLGAFKASGSGTLLYTKGDDKAEVKESSIPPLVYESDDAPNGMDHLTVIAEGLIGSEFTVDWSAYPRVALNDMTLLIKAYDIPADQVTGGAAPVFEVTLDDIDLSTDPVEVNGVKGGGYIDVKNMEAQFAGAYELPPADDQFYTEHLAGQTVIVELLVKLK
jgi:hypothetical protein